jgi:surfactin synthase thioesterase subunit
VEDVDVNADSTSEVTVAQEGVQVPPATAPPTEEQGGWRVEMRNHAEGEMLPDGRVCAIFVTGWASSPLWQFSLVFRDLAKSVPAMAIKYVDCPKEKFDPGEIGDKIMEEVGRGEYRRYLVVGMGMGGQLVYNTLLRLNEEMADRVTGILFSTPASSGDIRNSSDLVKWLFKKDKLARFLDRFRKIFWKLFGEKRNTGGQPDGVVEAYTRRRAFESQFPVTTFFRQGSYFYGFKVEKPVDSRLVVVNAVDDNFIKSSGGWDKLGREIEQRTIAGGHGDSVVRHLEFARIVADEVNREEQILRKVMADYEGIVY